jgi:NAD(P)-dependent dehydrogenase (short-subunit alcohol dehydrogenase family)
MSGSWYRNRVVLITGASSGIGRATAKLAAARGARLVLISRSDGPLAELADEVGRGPERVLVAHADVSRPEGVRAAVERALGQFGRIDVAISNAGIEYPAPGETLAADELRTMMDTNFYGLVHVAQAVLPPMRRQGSGTLVYVSSPMGRLAFPQTAGYAATKAAGDAFALGLRRDLAGTAIRVVTVYPGPTESGNFKHLTAERIPAWHRPSRPPLLGTPRPSRPAVPARPRRARRASIPGPRRRRPRLGHVPVAGYSSLRCRYRPRCKSRGWTSGSDSSARTSPTKTTWSPASRVATRRQSRWAATPSRIGLPVTP